MAFEINSEVLRSLQQKSLEIAVYFADFCRKNGLLCYFCGGGAIGAVRHGGFIPWDDDLDFFMPRPDYERLLNIWNERADTKKYQLQVTTDEIITENQFATVCDGSTTYIKTYMSELDINHGLSIDIIPLDGRPKTDGLYSLRRKIQILWALVYSLFIIGKAPENHGGFVKFCGKAALFVFRSKGLRRRIWRRALRKMTKYDFYKADYVCELTTGPVFMRRDYPESWFSGASYHDFEGYSMPLPVGYNEYLTMAFGDYMTLPPESERTAHHDFEYIDMNNSYKKYKGVYFCREDGRK